MLFFCIAICAQSPIKKRNHFQTAGHVFKTSFNTIPSDFVFLGKEFSDDWKKTGYYAAGILGLIATDKITKDRTSIIIAHRLATIKKADKIIVMEEGKIVEIGSHKDLIQKEKGHYKNLYEVQFLKKELV